MMNVHPTRAFSRLRTRALRWWRDEDGVLTIEFLFFFPVMIWIWIASIAYFDAYRTESNTQKAAMTVADMISREQDNVSDTYLNGAYGLLQFLTPHDPAPLMRISVLRYRTKAATGTSTDRYDVVWSRVRGSSAAQPLSPMTNAESKTLMNKLPLMGNEDRLILVETTTDFTSGFNIGLRTLFAGQSATAADYASVEIKDAVLKSFIFSAPRLGQTCFNNTPTNVSARVC
ncbi:hypothetical protein SAMN04488003_12154 [Loktanella fryxellensis]|uniref:Flp pilus assembly protein TadG n=1 Tax=Loktanella fryxellensis TaxID=245187 RepID=A0A1H8HMF6_9RHOB|nr:hypothetical protein [Loktanella fryxellensis]SEN57157.1 hypothetical protein SAMN04488003_12154 [Loktanella fryxellensis]